MLHDQTQALVYICFLRMTVRENDRILDAGLPHNKYLSENQLKILLQYVKDNADEARRKGAIRSVVNELIVEILIHTGLQASEICNLNIEDLPISHNENTIWIRGSMGNVTRKIEISTEIVGSLNKFVKLYRQGASLNSPLFVSERGGRLSYMSLYSKLKIIGNKVGIRRLHPQMLRHAYIVRLYDVTQDLRLTQLQAGHAHSSSTERYAKSSRQKANAQFLAWNVKAYKGNQSSSPTQVEPVVIKSTSSTPLSIAPVSVECEACGKSIVAKAATKIDSGQLLCHDCIKELRGHSY